MERKTPKEPFQGEEGTQASLFPLKVTPITFLIAMALLSPPEMRFCGNG